MPIPQPRTLVASTDDTNWEICKEHGLWGVRATATVGLKRVGSLGAGDQLAVWVNGSGFVALAALNAPPQQPWPADIQIPWSDGAEYGMMVEIGVTEEYANPVHVPFAGGYAPALRLDKNSLFSFGQLDDAQIQRIRDIGAGRVDPNEAPPFARAWFVIQTHDSDYSDKEGAWYHYPLKIPNAKRIEAGDVLVFYRPTKARTADSGKIFGVGRIASIDDDGETHRFALLDRYQGFPGPVPLTEIGGDPRMSTQHSISSMPMAGVERLVELAGAPSIDELPKQEPTSPPKTQPDEQAQRSKALVIYVGASADENLSFGLDNGVWGWRREHDDYHQSGPGDVLIFGSGYTGGSPRTTSESFAANGLNRLVECRITGSLREEAEPLWPDEKREGQLVYPFRIAINEPQELGGMSVADLDARYGGEIGEALRLSAASGGRGVLVEIGERPEIEIDTTGVSLTDVCLGASEAIRASGLDYGERHEALIRSFIVSLATKRLVLLTGLSGSGKTRLGLGFGQWLGPDQYMVVPVRPDWTGPDALLGYENQLSAQRDGHYAWVVPDTLEFMLRAARDPRRPYLLLLDEMNLAHVERYFADVLSGVESGERIIPDLAQVEGEWRPLSQEKLPFPDNLFVVGTVNIDETTYMFSPKVLDRANTLEFRVRTEDLDGEVTALSAVTRGDERLLARFLADATNPELGDGWAHRAEMAAALTELHSILSSIDREFGHRVFQEALRFGFLLDLAGDSDWLTALDYQVMQKILPRFHGSVKQIAEPLRLLGSWCFHGIGTEPSADFDPVSPPDDEPELPVSFDKIARMYRRVMADHFVSFAE